MTAMDKLKAAIAAKGTDTLLAALDALEAKAQLSEEERMVKAATSDVIEERHGLTAAMDAIYADHGYAGSYTAALKAALAVQREQQLRAAALAAGAQTALRTTFANLADRAAAGKL